MLGPTAHTDTFARDKLPPPEQWPNLLPGEALIALAVGLFKVGRIEGAIR